MYFNIQNQTTNTPPPEVLHIYKSAPISFITCFTKNIPLNSLYILFFSFIYYVVFY